jgi:hypothetical protein
VAQNGRSGKLRAGKIPRLKGKECSKGQFYSSLEAGETAIYLISLPFWKQ